MGKRKNKAIPNGFNWCFAIVNNRLAEIYFGKKKEIWGHCYVKREDYSKGEQKMIDEDIKWAKFVWRNKKYIRKKNL